MDRIGVAVAGLALASCLGAVPIVTVPDAAYTWRTEGDPNRALCQNPNCQPQELVSGTAPGGGELTTYSGLAETYPGLPNPLNLLDPFAFARFANSATQEVQSFASVQYFFEVVGPANSNIPVDIQYSVSASYRTPGGITESQGTSRGAVQLYLGDGTPTQVGVDAQCAFTDCDQSSSGVLHLNAEANFVYMLSVSASADGNFPSESGSASADPYLYIDPSFTGTGYSLAFSDGISNTPPGTGSTVPEPASSALVGMGLVAAAVIRRRFRGFSS
jgi:hypothetical protein